MSRSTVLVTGATGCVGSRLATALAREGHDVLAMTRRPDEYDGAGRPVAGDVADRDSLVRALRGVDVAYYLIHSLSWRDFERRDGAAARAFGGAAAEAGVRQIVYLGGLGRDGERLSRHLRSRREVEHLLGLGGVPVTVLRAAVVVGHGSVSWEMTRQLARNLPLMVAPPWAATRTQPVSLRDTVRYLVAVRGHRDAIGRTFEIGGADVLTYGEMLRRAAGARQGRELAVLPLPVVGGPLARGAAEKASSLVLSLLTDVDPGIAAALIASMSTEVVVTDHSIRSVVDLEPLGYDEMVREALVERLRDGHPV